MGTIIQETGSVEWAKGDSYGDCTQESY